MRFAYLWIISILWIYLTLFVGERNALLHRTNNSEWQLIDSFPFIGNKLKDFRINTTMLPISHITNKFTDDSIYSCKHTNKSIDLNGKIAIVGIYNGCSLEKHIEVAERAGAIGVLLLASWDVCNLLDFNSGSRYNNTIPAICLDTDESEEFLNIYSKSFHKNEPIYVQYDLEGKNPLNNVNRGGFIFFQSFFIVGFSVMILASITRFITNVVIEKEVLNMKNSIIFCCLIAEISAILMLVDPFGYYQRIKNYQYRYIISYINLFAYSILFYILSVHFTIFLVVTYSLSPYIKYSAIIINTLIEVASLMGAFANKTLFCLYISNQNSILTSEIIGTVIYGIQLGVFYFRCYFIFRNIYLLRKHKNEDFYDRKYNYIHILVCLLLICLGFTITFAIILQDNIDYMQTPETQIIRLSVYFVGCFFSLSGSTFLFQPKKPLNSINKEFNDNALNEIK